MRALDLCLVGRCIPRRATSQRGSSEEREARHGTTRQTCRHWCPSFSNRPPSLRMSSSRGSAEGWRHAIHGQRELSTRHRRYRGGVIALWLLVSVLLVSTSVQSRRELPAGSSRNVGRSLTRRTLLVRRPPPSPETKRRRRNCPCPPPPSASSWLAHSPRFVTRGRAGSGNGNRRSHSWCHGNGPLHFDLALHLPRIPFVGAQRKHRMMRLAMVVPALHEGPCHVVPRPASHQQLDVMPRHPRVAISVHHVHERLLSASLRRRGEARIVVNPKPCLMLRVCKHVTMIVVPSHHQIQPSAQRYALINHDELRE